MKSRGKRTPCQCKHGLHGLARGLGGVDRKRLFEQRKRFKAAFLQREGARLEKDRPAEPRFQRVRFVAGESEEPVEIPGGEIAPAEQERHLGGVDRADEAHLRVVRGRGHRGVEVGKSAGREGLSASQRGVARLEDAGESAAGQRERVARIRLEQALEVLAGLARRGGGARVRPLEQGEARRVDPVARGGRGHEGASKREEDRDAVHGVARKGTPSRRVTHVENPRDFPGPTLTSPRACGLWGAARRPRMISVKVTQLTKRFGPVTALRGLDLTIEPGELFFLLGPSGCGKTTLLRSMAGFYLPEEGTIHFGDEDVTRLPPHKRNTGMMFQSYALWPHMSVAQNVAFGLEERKVPRAEIKRRVGAALESVHMGGYADRRPNQLSGGQQQRVALARALVIRPRCLLLDEPLSNLDARLRLEMRGEIRRVCKEFNLTTVYVTHDQKEALSIADRMAVLDGGRILQVGAPPEVYRRPVDRTVAHFIGETNFIEGTVRSVGGGRAVVDTPLGRFEGVPTAGASALAEGGAAILSIRPECLRLSANGSAGGGERINRVDCEVGEAVYLGEVAQYALLTAGAALKVFELNPRRLIQAGRKGVVASADPEDVAVLAG